MCNPIFSREIGPAISEFVLIKQVLLCTLNTEYVFCTMTHLSPILIFVSGSPLVKSELIIWKFSYRSCSQVSYDFIYALILGEVGSVFQGQLTWLCAFPFSLNFTVELIHRNITSIQRWEINMISMWWGNVKSLVWQWLVQPWEPICWVN